VLDVLVSEVRLKGARVVALGGQCEAIAFIWLARCAMLTIALLLAYLALAGLDTVLARVLTRTGIRLDQNIALRSQDILDVGLGHSIKTPPASMIAGGGFPARAG
jgi:hypothetical protein